MSKSRSSLVLRLLQRIDESITVPGWIKRRIEKYSVASKINFIILTAVLPMLFVLSMIFLGERLYEFHGVGIAFIALGIYLATVYGRRSS